MSRDYDHSFDNLGSIALARFQSLTASVLFIVMSLSSLLQFVLGVITGLILLLASGTAAGYYFFTRMVVTPGRPVYSEERATATPAPPDPEPENAPPEPETPAESLEPESATEELEPGAYRATVTWPDGLSLRSEPSGESESIGGLAYDQEMIILRTSQDGNWEQIRLPNSDRTGWVRAGNSEAIEE